MSERIEKKQTMMIASQLIPTSLAMRLLLFCILLSTITSCAHSTNAIKKNVLFIIVDDLRPALGCYDDVRAVTPKIDRFAEKSVLFRRTYAQVKQNSNRLLSFSAFATLKSKP